MFEILNVFGKIVMLKINIYAEVMKLVDVLDSKSCVGNHVPVRVRPSAFLFESFINPDMFLLHISLLEIYVI